MITPPNKSLHLKPLAQVSLADMVAVQEEKGKTDIV